MPQGDQVRNGKAYALANAYASFVTNNGKNVSFVQNDALVQAIAYNNVLDFGKKCFC